MEHQYKDPNGDDFTAIQFANQNSKKIKRQRKLLNNAQGDPGSQEDFNRIFDNLNELSNSTDYYHILKQLQEDLKLYPTAISIYLEHNNIYECFKIIMDDPEVPPQIFELIYQIIQCDKRSALSFLPAIPEIFTFIYHPNIHQIAYHLVDTIIQMSNQLNMESNLYDIFIIENIFETVQQQNPAFHPFEIIESIYTKCSFPIFKANLPLLFTNLHVLFSQIHQDQNLNDDQRLTNIQFIIKLFRILLKRIADINKQVDENNQICINPKVILTPIIFHNIIEIFDQTGSVECLRLINEILVYEYNNSSIPTFFMDYKELFHLLTKFLDNELTNENTKRVKLILRIYANFSILQNYLNCIVESQIYLTLLDFIFSTHFSFSFFDDFSIIACRLFCFIPDIIASNPHFPNLLEMVLNSIESQTSEFLDQAFINMLECLEIKIPELELPIDFNEILSRVSLSSSLEIENWILKRTSE